MSDTPRTDRALEDRGSIVSVDANFARQLERELVASNNRRELLQSRLNEARNGVELFQWRECARELRSFVLVYATNSTGLERTRLDDAISKLDALEKGEK